MADGEILKFFIIIRPPPVCMCVRAYSYVFANNQVETYELWMDMFWSYMESINIKTHWLWMWTCLRVCVCEVTSFSIFMFKYLWTSFASLRHIETLLFLEYLILHIDIFSGKFLDQ